jgi:hypothetical protein
MHGLDEVLDNHYIKDVAGSIVCSRSRGLGVQPTDQAGVYVFVIMQERAPGCDQPRRLVRVLRIEVTRH